MKVYPYPKRFNCDKMEIRDSFAEVILVAHQVELMHKSMSVDLDAIYHHLAITLQANLIMHTCAAFGPLTHEQLQIIESGILEALNSMEIVSEEKLAEYKKIRHMVSKYTPKLQGKKGRAIYTLLDFRILERIFALNRQEVADMNVTLCEHLSNEKELKGENRVAYVRLREMYMEFLELAQYEEEEYDEFEI